MAVYSRSKRYLHAKQKYNLAPNYIVISLSLPWPPVHRLNTSVVELEQGVWSAKVVRGERAYAHAAPLKFRPAVNQLIDKKFFIVPEGGCYSIPASNARRNLIPAGI